MGAVRLRDLRSCQDCHTRAWQVVSQWVKDNMAVFGGRLMEAESTTMPAARSWIMGQAQEIGNCSSDHAVFIFVNCPAMGILGASHRSFMLSFITNILADYKENGIVFVVHSNRAAQTDGRMGSGQKGKIDVAFLMLLDKLVPCVLSKVSENIFDAKQEDCWGRGQGG